MTISQYPTKKYHDLLAVGIINTLCFCVWIFLSWVPKPEFIVFFGSLFNFRSLRIHTWHMTSIKTSSTTPGQRSPDMGGFFQLLYNGSFGAGHQICICHKDWGMDTGGDWIIFKQKKSLESISNRIIWKKRVWKNDVSQWHLKKCSCTTTTTTEGKLCFF